VTSEPGPTDAVTDPVKAVVKSVSPRRERLRVPPPRGWDRSRPSEPVEGRGLPHYDNQLSRFHRAFELELTEILATLPLTPAMDVLDLACGDGFYAHRIADRLGPGASVTGVDLNLAYISAAQQAEARHAGGAAVSFVAASFDRLPFPDESFDFVWCAQSLQSLPDPVVVLEHAVRVLRPGGIVAILENDTMHKVLLPWPIGLELPLRVAELRAFSEKTRDPSKYYVARRLPAVLAAVGVEPLNVTTRAFDRQAPFGESEQELLQSYLEEIARRVAPYLDPSLLQELRQLGDATSSQHMVRQPHLTMTWLNVLALGRKPR
jgi:demethylmenaquinone methyltransferase / 2-methoxy-6-polyprenyl-1,4-benzoquinol methylase